MEQEGFAYEFPKVQYDQEGFTKSFSLEQLDQSPQDIANYYRTYGFVILDNIIGPEEAQKTIDQLWNDIKEWCDLDVDRHDKTTWVLNKWKGSYGFVNSKPLNSLQICLNRQNPLVYKAFKRMYEITSGKQLLQPLIAQFDRGSAMRPAGINKQWLAKSIYHFDINPWWWTKAAPSSHKNWRHTNDYVPEKFAKWNSEGNFVPNVGYTKLAGVLALSDTNDLSGGFECVPGFHNCITQWCKHNPINTAIQSDDNLMKNFQKIFQRKGSLLLFSRQLPHNIYPNLSEEFRFAQYLRMSPLSALVLTPYEVQKRKKCVQHFLPKELPIQNDISKEIYMLD